MYQGVGSWLLEAMTPHPLASWVTMQLVPRQRVVRRQRRRRLAVRLLHRVPASESTVTETRIPIRSRSRPA